MVRSHDGSSVPGLVELIRVLASRIAKHDALMKFHLSIFNHKMSYGLALLVGDGARDSRRFWRWALFLTLAYQFWIQFIRLEPSHRSRWGFEG